MTEVGKQTSEYKYDICLSFAGENRDYVQQVAEELIAKGIRVFYDEYEQIELWGKDLYAHLDYVYRNAARYCVIFISKYYASKLWTNHERKSAQARAFSENKEYILPARFDDTDITGILPTIGMINLEEIEPPKFAEMIIEKIGHQQNTNFLPPKLDRLYTEMDKLYTELRITNKKNKEIIESQARSFFAILERLSSEERLVLMTIFLHGCIRELPYNTHIAIDLVRRYTEFPIVKIKRIMSGLKSLGILSQIREGKDSEFIGKSPQIVLQFHIMNTSEFSGNATDIAYVMIRSAILEYCAEHGMEKLLNLDFSQLSNSTFKEHQH